MKINNIPWLPIDFQPNLLIWGCHEETRGTHWIEINSEGFVSLRDYFPNDQGTTKRKQVRSLAPTNFDSLLRLIRQIVSVDVEFSLPASGTVLSLECISKDTAYQLIIPAAELKQYTAIQRVAEAFYTQIIPKTTTCKNNKLVP